MNQPLNQLKKVFLSKQGLEMFEKRLEKQKKLHADLCTQREVAHDLSGDGWHDNPHFNYLQQMEANSSWKIFELQEVLNKARLYEVTEGQRPTDYVSLGSVVRIDIEYIDTQKVDTKILEIVGYQEGNPQLGQISYESPLGSLLMGLEVEDYVESRLPQGEVFIEVIELYSTKS